MLEALAEVFVQAAEPRSAHAPVHAVKSARLSWVNKLAAGLGHGRSLGLRALRENQIGRNLGSDLSEGWVSRLLCYPGCFGKKLTAAVADVIAKHYERAGETV